MVWPVCEPRWQQSIGRPYRVADARSLGPRTEPPCTRRLTIWTNHMTESMAFHLIASVTSGWAWSTERWEFALPTGGQPGRMRVGCNERWRPWHPLSHEQSIELAALCRETLSQRAPSDKRHEIPVDGTAMQLRLQGPTGGPPLEGLVSLASLHAYLRGDPASPLIRMVAKIHDGPWPDTPPMEDWQPEVHEAPEPGEEREAQVGFAGMTPPQWPGRSERGSVILPLPEARNAVPGETLVYRGLLFQAKDELHLTLLSAQEANAVAEHMPETQWREIFEARRWTLYPGGKLVMLEEESNAGGPQYSLVTLMHCPALNEFRRQLSDASGVFLTNTQPHVTLWVKPGSRGIGITSVAEYRRFRVIELLPNEAAPFLGGTVFDLGIAPNSTFQTGDRRT